MSKYLGLLYNYVSEYLPKVVGVSAQISFDRWGLYNIYVPKYLQSGACICVEVSPGVGVVYVCKYLPKRGLYMCPSIFGCCICVQISPGVRVSTIYFMPHF